MVNIQSPTAEIRRGKKRKKKKERRNSMKILWSALLHRATIIKTITRLGENETCGADLGRSTSSKFTPGFYKSQPQNRSYD